MSFLVLLVAYSAGLRTMKRASEEAATPSRRKDCLFWLHMGEHASLDFAVTGLLQRQAGVCRLVIC